MEALEPRIALAGDFAYGFGLGSAGSDQGLAVALDPADHRLTATNVDQVPSDIRGTLWNDSNGNGRRESSESVLSGRTVYLDQNLNEQLDSEELTTVTDANGNFVFSGLSPGAYVVRQILPQGWEQTSPNRPDNVLVTHQNQVSEYTPSGTRVRTLNVPWPGDSSWPDNVYDVIADRHGRIHVFQASIDEGYISTYDPVSASWQHHTHAGLHALSNISRGELSIHGDDLYVFNYRFNVVDWSSERFAIDEPLADIALGRDGLLYGTVGGSPAHELFVYDSSFTLLRTLSLRDEQGVRRHINSVAVNEQGEVFALDINGLIYRYSADGVLQDSLNTGLPSTNDLNLSFDGKLIAGQRFGNVAIAGEALESSSAFPVGNGITFVAFSNYDGRPGSSIVVSVQWGENVQGIGFGSAEHLVNEPPHAFEQSVAVSEDGSIGVALTGDDGDPQMQTLTFAIAVQPSHGVLIDFDPQTGAVTYLPDPDYFGPDSFSFTVTDDASAGGPALTSMATTVSINVLPAGDPPTANDDSVVIAEDSGPVAIDVLANDTTAPDAGEVLSLGGIVAGDYPGEVEVGPDGRTVIYTPAPNFVGQLSIGYIIRDNHELLGSAQIIIHVENPRNEVIVAAPDAGHSPLARIFDAEQGHLLHEIMAFNPGFQGGVRIAMADVNRDGVEDVIAAAGSGGGPHVRVFDGTTGEPLPGAIGSFFAYTPSFTGGVFVAAGDLNGDGYADIVTGADAGGGPHVRIFSGFDGRELGSFFAFSPKFSGGVRVAIGDVDFDGLAEIITAAGPGGAPEVRVYENAAGVPLNGPRGNFLAYNPGFAGGVYVAAGDLNGDGYVEIITGAGAGGGPHVKAFDGATGGIFREFFAYNADFNGGVRVAVGHLDDDGVLDIITAPGTTGGPHIRGFDPVTLMEHSSFYAYDSEFTGGLFIAGRRHASVPIGSASSGTSLNLQAISSGQSHGITSESSNETLLSPVSSRLDPALVDNLLAAEW